MVHRYRVSNFDVNDAPQTERPTVESINKWKFSNPTVIKNCFDWPGAQETVWNHLNKYDV